MIIRFFGDFTTCENYQARYDVKFKRNILRQKGYDYLLKDTAQYLKNSYNIVNLESPITSVETSELSDKKPSVHWMDPNIAGDFLSKYGIDVVSLGNNHGYDYGEQGLRQTLEVLKKSKIEYFGAGLNSEEACAPFKKTFQIEDKNINFYIFGGYKYRENFEKDFDFYAKENKPGVALLTPEAAENNIKNIKQNDRNSFVIMFPHFGFDFFNRVEHQVEYAHAWVDAGADLIIGHGPHFMNEIEFYKDKLIIYSLGNFLFPASFKKRLNPYGLVAELELCNDIQKIQIKKRLYPIYLKNRCLAPIARPIKKEEIPDFTEALTNNKKEILDKIKIVDDELIFVEV